MTKIRIKTNAAKILRSLTEFPPAMSAAVAGAMNLENELTLGHIQKNKLSKRGPKTLGVVTNRLRRSGITVPARVIGTLIRSGLGSNVVYAGTHEFGFSGTVQVRAFSRRNPQADKFSVGGKQISRQLAESMGLFDKRGRLRIRKNLAQTSSGVSRVRAHSRRMNLPERAMFRTGIEERADNYATAISDAISTSWKSV